MAPRARAPRSKLKPKGHKDVLFVYDEPGAGKPYRCDYQAEELHHVGMSSDVAQSADIDLVAAVDHYDTFILHRLEWSKDVAHFVEAARRAERSVVFDTDDLIFEPEIYLELPWLKDVSESVRKGWRDRFDRYRQTLEACDRAIVSSDPLGTYAGRRVRRTDVVYNAVGSELVERADEALASRSYAETAAEDRNVMIAYLSGSPGHDRAFLEAADAVLELLETHAHVRLLLVGFLDPDPRFDRFGSRVMKVPKQPLPELSKLIARVDINLAPLEGDNAFTECKSCVKYLEAGLVRVPTVASARPDFVRVIEHGRNGMLADTPSEWHDAISELVENPEHRRTMGALAYEDVRENHTTKSRAGRLRLALETAPAFVNGA
jgi:glycosyltransferase involved in cell wall biosynthesis